MKAIIANPAPKKKAAKKKAAKKNPAKKKAPAKRNPSLLVVNPKPKRRKPRPNPKVSVADAFLSFLATGGSAIVSAYGIDRLVRFIEEKTGLSPWITNGGALAIGGVTAVGSLVWKGPAMLSGSGLGIAVRGGSGLIDEAMEALGLESGDESGQPIPVRGIPASAPALRGGIEPSGLLSLVEYEYHDDPQTTAALAGLIG